MGTRFMSDPLISSLFMRTVSEDEKSTANSLRMISFNLSSVISPWLGGTMMEKISLDSPAYTGAIMTFLLAFLIPVLLRKEIQTIDESEKVNDSALAIDNTVIVEEA
jgi:predicted MFS family arabinose efflux permease